MKCLPNNCRVGKFSVNPRNWDKYGADMSICWTITYRFYDDNADKNKQIRRQGMNEFKDLKERQFFTRKIIQEDILKLEAGYNPIFDVYKDESNNDLPRIFHAAINFACENKAASELTKIDLKTVAAKINKAAEQLSYNNLPIREIKKLHIRKIFDKLAKDENWSNNNWNKYRAYTMILFKELCEYDIIETNFIRDISKRKATKKARIVLNETQRIDLKKHLIENYYRFYLFTNIFFHSGARESEFFRLQLKDIDLERQTIKFLVKKGPVFVEVIKPIKDVAVKYWKQYLQGFDNRDNYFLGTGFKPAETMKENRFYISNYWRRVTKKKLGINVDFYALKHLNTDEVSESIGIEMASKLNSHTSINTTKIYAINEDARKMELIKKVANEF